MSRKGHYPGGSTIIRIFGSGKRRTKRRPRVGLIDLWIQEPNREDTGTALLKAEEQAAANEIEEAAREKRKRATPRVERFFRDAAQNLRKKAKIARPLSKKKKKSEQPRDRMKGVEVVRKVSRKKPK